MKKFTDIQQHYIDLVMSSAAKTFRGVPDDIRETFLEIHRTILEEFISMNDIPDFSGCLIQDWVENMRLHTERRFNDLIPLLIIPPNAPVQ